MERKEFFDQQSLKIFAERIKQVRKEKGITQEDLAANSGLVLSQIARIETVKINPRLSTVFQIARGLNVDLDVLFNFKLPPKEIPN